MSLNLGLWYVLQVRMDVIKNHNVVLKAENRSQHGSLNALLTLAEAEKALDALLKSGIKNIRPSVNHCTAIEII